LSAPAVTVRALSIQGAVDPEQVEQPTTERGIVSAMGTSNKDASLAGKQLKNKKSTPAQKSVAGSDLAQAKRKPKKK
jgi:hypothetical protein